MCEFSHDTFVNAAVAANKLSDMSKRKQMNYLTNNQKKNDHIIHQCINELSIELLNNRLQCELIQYINTRIINMNSINFVQILCLQDKQIIYLLHSEQNIYAKNVQQIYFLTNKINILLAIIKKYKLISDNFE